MPQLSRARADETGAVGERMMLGAHEVSHGAARRNWCFLSPHRGAEGVLERANFSCSQLDTVCSTCVANISDGAARCSGDRDRMIQYQTAASIPHQGKGRRNGRLFNIDNDE